MGGIGKKQIALEYIYRQKNAYSSIFWINAETKFRLSERFYSIASAVGISTEDHAMIKLVREWLSSTGESKPQFLMSLAAIPLTRSSDEIWLLVFYEVDDFSILMPFIPKSTESHPGVQTLIYLGL